MDTNTKLLVGGAAAAVAVGAGAFLMGRSGQKQSEDEQSTPA